MSIILALRVSIEEKSSVIFFPFCCLNHLCQFYFCLSFEIVFGIFFNNINITKVACGEPVETRDSEDQFRRSRSRSVDRKGATIININQDDPDIPPISSPPPLHPQITAPLVSPETDTSPSDVSDVAKTRTRISVLTKVM